jgi:hypothetical protein
MYDLAEWIAYALFLGMVIAVVAAMVRGIKFMLRGK